MGTKDLVSLNAKLRVDNSSTCCLKSCLLAFTETVRRNLLTEFNNLATYELKTRHLAEFMHSEVVKRRRDFTKNQKIRHKTTTYTVRGMWVCRKAFIQLFGITQKRITVVRLKLEQECYKNMTGQHLKTKKRNRGSLTDIGNVSEVQSGPEMGKTSWMDVEESYGDLEGTGDEQVPKKKKKRKHRERETETNFESEDGDEIIRDGGTAEKNEKSLENTNGLCTDIKRRKKKRTHREAIEFNDSFEASTLSVNGCKKKKKKHKDGFAEKLQIKLEVFDDLFESSENWVGKSEVSDDKFSLGINANRLQDVQENCREPKTEKKQRKHFKVSNDVVEANVDDCLTPSNDTSRRKKKHREKEKNTERDLKNNSDNLQDMQEDCTEPKKKKKKRKHAGNEEEILLEPGDSSIVKKSKKKKLQDNEQIEKPVVQLESERTKKKKHKSKDKEHINLTVNTG